MTKRLRQRGFFVTDGGRKYYFDEVGDMVREKAPETLGEHIFIQLEAVGLMEVFSRSATPVTLPYTFAEKEAV